MTESVVVEADGGSRGNPGPAGYGAVVFDPATGSVLAERSEAIGQATNNVAEYRGLIAGLRAAAELGARRVRVRLDSKLLVQQMNGVYQVKSPGLRDLAREAAALSRRFEAVTFEWVPREHNKHADRLANQAMDRAAGKPMRTATARAAAGTATAGPAAGTATAGPAAGTATGSWAPPTTARTRLVLLRHAATEHSAAGRFSGRNDLPLEPRGREQAALLAAREFGTVAAVVSSPLPRAVETAQVVAASLGLAVDVFDDLTETDFGVWEGRTFAEAIEADPGVMRDWHRSPDVAPPGGESFTEVAERVERARAALVTKYPGSTVVVVTHVTPIKLLVCSALAAPPVALFRLHLDTASASTVDYYADGNVSVRLVNDTSHLRRPSGAR